MSTGGALTTSAQTRALMSEGGDDAFAFAFGEARDVFAAVAQRWVFDGKDAEAVEEVLAETAGFDLGFEVAIGRGRTQRPFVIPGVPW